MEKDVTVVPADNIIIVNRKLLHFDFSPIEGHESMHALQWHDGKGAIEYEDVTKRLELTKENYAGHVQPYVKLWQAEKARLNAEEEAKEAEYNKVENVKSRKLARLNSALNAVKASSGASIKSSTGYTVNANTTAKQNVDGLITAMTSTGTDSVNFMTFDNTLVQLTLDQLKTIQLELISYGNNLYARKWELRNAIEACTTKEEVDAINITFSDVTA